MRFSHFKSLLFSLAITVCCLRAGYVDFRIKAEAVIPEVQASIAKAREELSGIGKLPRGKCTLENVIEVLAKQEADLALATGKITLLMHNSPDQKLREACAKASRLIDEFGVEQEARKELFLATEALVKNLAHKIDSLEPETRRFIEKLMQTFKNAGFELPTHKFAELKALRGRLAELEAMFVKNGAPVKKSIWIRTEDLEGCNMEALGQVHRQHFYGFEHLGVAVFGPTLTEILTYAKLPETRRRAYIESLNEISPNERILEEAVRTRAQIAHLLGYATHADLALENKMAKKGETAINFEIDLLKYITPSAGEELKQFKVLKAAELGTPLEQTIIEPWDKDYYTRILKEKTFALNLKPKEYFDVAFVLPQMLDIFATVLGLKFTLKDDLPVWQAEVMAYQVNDAASGELLGYLYFDLYMREAKLASSACIELVPGFLRDPKTGERQVPTAAVSVQFPAPTATMPCLIEPDQVRTLFHEFGHAMHVICSKTRYSRFHGSLVEHDFKEAPSQILENWVWDKAIMKRLSRHYKTGQQLTDEAIDKILQERRFLDGLENLEKISFGLVDLLIHSMGQDMKLPCSATSIRDLYTKVNSKFTLVPSLSEAFPISKFMHLMMKYDAGYYGYMWSDLYAMDMFESRFAAEGLLNPATGVAYRREILQPGGSRDAIESVRAFLGREPKQECLLRSLVPKAVLQLPTNPPNPSPNPSTTNSNIGNGNGANGLAGNNRASGNNGGTGSNPGGHNNGSTSNNQGGRYYGSGGGHGGGGGGDSNRKKNVTTNSAPTAPTPVTAPKPRNNSSTASARLSAAVLYLLAVLSLPAIF